MRTSVCRIAMLWVFVLGVPVAAARAAGAEDVDATRFQYDELTMHPPAGQPTPGPDSFDRHYAETLDYFAHAASLASLRADAAAKRDAAMKALNAPGAGDRITGMLTGQITDLLSRANPVAGMLFGVVAGAARGYGRDDEAVAEQAASDAETKFRREQMARPKLRRIAIWDRWLRVDDLDDGSAVIHKPDVGEYLVLDTRQKTWVRLAAAPVDADMQRIGADPQRCRYAVQRDIERIGTRTIDGRDAEGYRSTERMPYDQGTIMVSEDTSWISGQRIPPDILEVMHGFPNCPPDSPTARSGTVPDDRVTPYQAVLARFEDAAGSPVPPPAGSDNTADMVYFEQHLRTLAHGDRDVLFSAPADYHQLQ